MTAVVVDVPELPELGDPAAVWFDPEDRRVLSDQLAARLQAVDVLARWCEAELIATLDVADRHGLYSVDGHRNIRSFAAANVNWSNAQCRDRARAVHLLRDVPGVAVDLAEGKIGIAQVYELARLRANPRCGDQVVEAADELVQAAKDLPFDDFKIVTQRWEATADADGAHKGHDAAHEGRRVSTATLDDTFHLTGQFGTIQGAAMAEILARFEQAEFTIDWETGKAVHGDAMNKALLERTASQRRADALYAIFMAAVSTPEGAQPPVPVVNIIVDQQTFEDHLRAAAGGPPPPPADPSDTSRRCETDTGAPVDPTHAVAAAIVGSVRRVVMNSAGVIIDMGRKSRCFTGSARVAAFLQGGRRCRWPGCGRNFGIQIDHATDWQNHGLTDTCNADPLCTWHNPFKNNGYRITRDDTGRWHTYRPDGTEMRPI